MRSVARCALSSVVEHSSDKGKVEGSIPSARTMDSLDKIPDHSDDVLINRFKAANENLENLAKETASMTRMLSSIQSVTSSLPKRINAIEITNFVTFATLAAFLAWFFLRGSLLGWWASLSENWHIAIFGGTVTLLAAYIARINKLFG